MTVQVPGNISTWEAVATLQIVQALKAKATCSFAVGIGIEAAAVACLGSVEEEQSGKLVCLNYETALRGVDRYEGYYGDLLAQVNGLQLTLAPPKLPCEVTGDGPIVLCPESIRSDMSLPQPAWKAMADLLRLYGYGVCLMGDYGYRLDGCKFSELDIVSNLPVKEKIQVLAESRLIVGVPNAWMWLGTAWDKKMMVLYPDGVPMHRWFPYSTDNQRWITFAQYNFQLPLLLSAARKWLREL